MLSGFAATIFKNMMKQLLGLMCGGGVLVVSLASAMEPQVNVPLITQMNRLPAPLNIPNWKQDALDYSQFIFDRNVTGSNMPVVNVVGQDFAFQGYMQPIGVNGRVTNDVNSTEAMTSVAPVIAAEMLGMDMTTYKGLNWVQSCKRWFNPGAGFRGLYSDGPNQSGSGGYLDPAIYGYWPMAIGMMLTDRHRSDPVYSTNLSLQCASVLQIAQAYGCPTNADFSLGRTYDLSTLSVIDLGNNGRWVPGMSSGLGWMLYVGYLWTGDTNYLACAQSALQFHLNYPGRYENAHQYGPLAVARLNAEQGTSLDLGRMMDNFFGDHTRMPVWVQSPTNGGNLSIWSVSRGWSPGGVQADGLDIAGRQDGGFGYAFTMGSYQNTAWLAPVTRYDQRFARNVGRYLLNAANSCRFLRGIDLDWDHQAHLGWRTNLIYQGVNKGFLFSYEGFRSEPFYPDPSGTAHSPYGTGDYLSNAGAGFGGPTNAAANYWLAKTNYCPFIPAQSTSTLSYFGWSSYDIALYMGNSMGFLGAIYNASSVPAIIGWDVVTTDYFHPRCYPGYLFWNPLTTATNVTFNFGTTNCDLYDAVSGVFVARNVQGNYAFTMGADQAMVLVVAPAGGVVSQVGTQLRINGVVVDYRYHGNGLLGEYFNNASQTNRVLARTDAQVNFAWGGSSPDPIVSSNNFSARWSGWLVPQYSETYTLSTVSSNQVRLTINDQVVINNFTNGSGSVISPSVTESDLSFSSSSQTFAPLAGNNLILGNSGTSIALNNYDTQNGWTPANLTDGNVQGPGAVGNGTGVYTIIGNNGTITYNLGNGANGLGFNITGVRTLTAWQGGGRVNPNYTLSYSTNGVNFTTLTTVNYSAPAGSQGTDVALGVTGLSNVKNIRFNFGANQQNNGITYTELAVFGTSSTVATNFLAPGGSNVCQVVLVANQPASIRLDYQGGGTNSGVQLLWSSPSLAAGLIPSDRLTPAPGMGLQGEYYVGTGLSNLAMVRPDSTINFNWSANPPAPFLNSRSQSVRWTGWLVPKYTETHTLTLQANDGARLWINNQLLSDTWTSHTSSSSVQVALTNNQPVAVRLEYYNSGLSTPTVSLSWSSPSQPSPEIVPAEQWLPPAGNGLAGEYFNRTGLTSRALMRTDAQVNFNWNGVAPDPAIYSNQFSVRWSGWLLPRYSETYTLTTATRDGVRLWLNDQLVINNWVSGAQTNTCTVALTAGKLAKIRMECFNSSGNGLAQLSWSSSSQTLEVIPQSQLIGPSAPPPPASAAVAPPNLPPLLTPTSDQSIRASSLLNLVASASDLDLPPQTLIYSLEPGAPSGASINPATGLFSWTPSVAQYPGTYGVTVRVTDNGNPPLSATNTFNVSVLAPPPPPPVVTETDLTFNSTSQTFAPLATNDLILGNAGDSSALNYFEAAGGWTPANLTDGDLKAPGTVGNGTGVYSIMTRGTVTYNLGGGANGTGYTITGIRSLTSWSGGGRVRPNYTVNYSLEGVYFYPIATVNYLAPDYTQGTDVALGVTGLTNAVSIQFVFTNTQQNGGVTYTELAVFGKSSRGTNIAPTQLVLGSSANPSLLGTNVTFTATVQAGGVTASDATGNLVFQVDGTSVFTNAVASGSATYANNTLALGAHSLTAIYRGDASYAASTNTLTQSIYLAPIVTETDLSLTNGSFAPLVSNDLILGNAGVAALTTVTYTGTATNLTDGVLQAPGNPGTSAQIVMIQTGTVTYNLGNGCNVTGIRSLTAWSNGTRIRPNYSVSYSWDGTNYLPLATVNYAAPSTARGTDVALAITGLTNVVSLQFTFPNSQQNSGVAYSELAVLGTVTPVVKANLSAQLLLPGLTNLVLNLSGLVAGQSYTLQSSPGLSPAVWSNAVPFVATQATAAITNATGTNAMQFFRLKY